MGESNHHTDVKWCVVGPTTILYHTTISMSIAVQYDQRTVFGSHGAYAVWTGTDPRSYNISANFVAANVTEAQYNVDQITAAYNWTQESPPKCKGLTGPTGVAKIFNTDVRPESVDSSIPEGVHLTPKGHLLPIQIDFSISVKECKEI